MSLAAAARHASVWVPAALLMLTASTFLTGPPGRVGNGSLADVAAGALFVTHPLPGLAAAAIGVAVRHLGTDVQFIAVGVAWSVLAWLQWRLVGWVVRRR